DEISLIDLFVVLLKYRKLVIVFAVLGIVISVGYYAIRKAGEKIEYEGSITMTINPRIGKGAIFSGWFYQKEFVESSFKDAGITNEKLPDYFEFSQNSAETKIVLKRGVWSKEEIEKLFLVMPEKLESMASSYYKQYALDIIAYIEFLQNLEKEYSSEDYIQYQWARDYLAGKDVVIKANTVLEIFDPAQKLNPVRTSGQSGSAGIVVVVIFFAFLFFAVFLAFVLNAIKNIGADAEAKAKIDEALGKGK
ncbi:MAG: hypothetical protein LBI94_00145, partial [Treponema sp.]|nr:hypothetical protein [Treponema sp.]